MALEDYTTYTETDEDSDLTVAENTITVDTMRNDALTHVVYDKGAGHFGDFEHLVGCTIGAYDSLALITHWAIAPSNGFCHQDRDDNNVGISVSSYEWYGYHIALKDHTNDNEDTYTSGQGTFYLTIERSSTTATCKIYSDSSRETLLDTLTITCGTTTYQYIVACASRHSTWSTTAVASGSNFNLDLQEGVSAYPQSSTVALGSALSISRPLSAARSSSNTMGFVTTSLKGIGEQVTHALGLTSSISKTLVGSVSSSATLGTGLTVSRALVAARSSLNTLGTSLTASRTIAIARSVANTLGLATSSLKNVSLSSALTLGLKTYAVFRERIKRLVTTWTQQGFTYTFPFNFSRGRDINKIGDDRELSSVGTDRIVRSK